MHLNYFFCFLYCLHSNVVFKLRVHQEWLAFEKIQRKRIELKTKGTMEGFISVKMMNLTKCKSTEVVIYKSSDGIQSLCRSVASVPIFLQFDGAFARPVSMWGVTEAILELQKGLQYDF